MGNRHLTRFVSTLCYCDGWSGLPYYEPARFLTESPCCPTPDLSPLGVMPHTPLARPIVVFGLAGLLPQATCLMLVIQGGPERWIALAAACFYAALILSFVGGMWWMAGLLSGLRTGWVYGLAVVPSLIGLAALLPWCLGWAWPGPSLVALALALFASSLVDRSLARHVTFPAGWLRLRLIMTGGLGLLTLLIAAA